MTFARSLALAPGTVVAPVRTLRGLARRQAPLWPLVVAVTLAYGLSRPADLASTLAQVEHGLLAGAALVIQKLLRFAFPELAGFALAGLVVGLLARSRGATEARLGEHALAGAYAAIPALGLVAAAGAARLVFPDLPRIDLPRSAGPGLAVLLPSLAVFTLHVRAVWRAPAAYAPPRLARGATTTGSPMAEFELDDDSPRRDVRQGLVFLGVAVVGALLILLGVIERWNAVKPPGTGELAPDVELALLDGETARLSDLRGKVVVVDFWATWCPPCVESMPGLDRLAREKGDEGLVAVAVNRDDPGALPEVKGFLAKHRLESLRVALDGSADAARAFRVQALPTLFVLDREGRIVASHVGGSSYEDLAELVEPLLAARAEAP